MTRYIAIRALQALPVLVLASIVVFLLMHLIPGGPLALYANDPSVSADDLERLRRELGLDVSLPEQYLNWLGAALHGDWGVSQVTHRKAFDEIAERLPNTLLLSGLAFLLALALSIPIGVVSAVRQYSWFDHVMTSLAFVGHAIPIFWFGLILIIVFNGMLRNPFGGGPLLPGAGMSTLGEPFTFGDRLVHLILPVSVLAFHNLSSHVRYLRAGMLDVLGQDYMRTARSKGLAERTVVMRHAFKNGILPLITIIGLEIPGLFNGALLAETVFSWPGMGRLFFTAIERSDYAVMMGVIMLSAALVLLFALVTDVAHASLDPRIRLER